jgi:hypothetical protein
VKRAKRNNTSGADPLGILAEKAPDSAIQRRLYSATIHSEVIDQISTTIAAQTQQVRMTVFPRDFWDHLQTRKGIRVVHIDKQTPANVHEQDRVLDVIGNTKNLDTPR